MDPLDEQSRRKAHQFYDSFVYKDVEIGTIKGLQQIHAYLFGGLYPFAGEIRTKNISKNGFMFANASCLKKVLIEIESMPENNFDEIVCKYVEMNVAHPFMDGNGRSARIWLDLILKKRLRLCVDWSKIQKEAYLEAMKKSPMDFKPISYLLKKALTSDIDNREIFLKGIDYSYYYEEVDD